VKAKKIQFMMPNAKQALSIAQVLFALMWKPVIWADPKIPKLTSHVEPGTMWVQSAPVMNLR
jgi:hypothetical protein